MISTRVGYAGGTTKNPTYKSIGDHTEVVRVHFDPQTIRYPELLVAFWKSHSPQQKPYSQQYRKAVFYHTKGQLKHARPGFAVAAKRHGKDLFTALEPAGPFYLAEGYHQKYYLRRWKRLHPDLASLFQKPRRLVTSTAAARLNGYLGGYGTLHQMKKELPLLGLTEANQKWLMTWFQSAHPLQCR